MHITFYRVIIQQVFLEPKLARIRIISGTRSCFSVGLLWVEKKTLFTRTVDFKSMSKVFQHYYYSY